MTLPKWFRRRALGVAALLGLCFLAGRHLAGYDNDNLARTMDSGPHRTINKLALNRFFSENGKDPILSRYDLKGAPKLIGEGVTKPGWTPADTTQGNREGTFKWWIEEGGYTADEPELYASFRHFYDPLEVGGATWLTDHLDVLERFYKVVAPDSVKSAFGRNFNPRIDAMRWAIEGPKEEGWDENHYCWKRGLEYMQQAFAATGTDKDRLFVKAWRSLGETMHLLGDMTSVPHVRNDSHPGLAIGGMGFGNYNPNEGTLKADPYESMTREHVIEAYAGGAVDPLVGARIKAVRTPEELFRAVAVYTQSSFFSADTLVGTDHLGRAVTPANGMPAYSKPRLDVADYNEKSGFYEKRVFDRKVKLAHATWLGANGWGSPMHAAQLSYACVKDQAAVLIPVAVAANARLLDLFIPRLEFRLTSFDPKTRLLKGQLQHRTGGAQTRPLVFNGGRNQYFNCWLDGSLQDWNRIKLNVTSNQVTADLSGLSLRNGQSVRLALDIGGILVKSTDFKLALEDAKPVPAPKAGPSISLCVYGFAIYDRGYSSKEQTFESRRWCSWELGYPSGGIPITGSTSFRGSRSDQWGSDEVSGTADGTKVQTLTWKGKRTPGYRTEEWEIVMKDIPKEPEENQGGPGTTLYMVRVWEGTWGQPYKQVVADPMKHLPVFKSKITFQPDNAVANFESFNWGALVKRMSVDQSGFILVRITR